MKLLLSGRHDVVRGGLRSAEADSGLDARRGDTDGNRGFTERKTDPDRLIGPRSGPPYGGRPRLLRSSLPAPERPRKSDTHRTAPTADEPIWARVAPSLVSGKVTLIQ